MQCNAGLELGALSTAGDIRECMHVLAGAPLFPWAVPHWRSTVSLGVQSGELLAQPQAALQQVVALVALALLILWAMMKKGKLLVDRPQLRPDLTHPW